MSGHNPNPDSNSDPDSNDPNPNQEYRRAPRKVLAHTALSDIRESIEELQYYRGAIFKPHPGWLGRLHVQAVGQAGCLGLGGWSGRPDAVPVGCAPSRQEVPASTPPALNDLRAPKSCLQGTTMEQARGTRGTRGKGGDWSSSQGGGEVLQSRTLCSSYRCSWADSKAFQVAGMAQ